MIPTAEMRAMLKEGEGTVSHVYLDPRGFVTVGVGCLLADAANLKSLPFVNRTTGALATDEEKSTEWMKISKQTFGTNYQSSYYKQFTALDLPDASITMLLDKRIMEFISELTVNFAQFPNFPPSVQLAILDMAFNLGTNGLMKFVEFVSAVTQEDWCAAATKCHRAAPVSEDRNQKIRNYLVIAAEQMFEGIWIGQYFEDGIARNLRCTINRAQGILAGTLSATDEDGGIITGPMRTPIAGIGRTIQFRWEQSISFQGTLPPRALRITGQLVAPDELPINFYLNR